jgi:nucleotide-binding universal stress UspA family protein
LVPIDGSDLSLKALEIAIQMAKKFKGKITLVHVYSVTAATSVVLEPGIAGGGVPVFEPHDISRFVEAAEKIGNRILSDGEQRAKAAEVEVEKLLEEGHTVQEIIRVAKEGNFELIVIGARGVSHIREMLLGSVSDGVMHHVTCPVLVVR